MLVYCKMRVKAGDEEKFFNRIPNGKLGDLEKPFEEKFPNHSTANQFWSSILFNKYRMLGWLSAREAFQVQDAKQKLPNPEIKADTRLHTPLWPWIGTYLIFLFLIQAKLMSEPDSGTSPC